MKTVDKKLITYFKEYKLIYIGALICNIGAFTFHKLMSLGNTQSIWFNLLIFTFFLLSFIVPVILSIIFTARCFREKSKIKLLVDIIHSYAGVLWIFAALYFQSIVFSDRLDAYRKNRIYEAQYQIMQQDANYQLKTINDRRAFKGIDQRLWSSYDYPSNEFIAARSDTTGQWKILKINNFQDIGPEEILTAIRESKGTSSSSYLTENVAKIYIDCLYFSIICMATVGFGDISPALWYTKLFTVLEVVIGMTIFVIAIGMLFSDFKLREEG